MTTDMKFPLLRYVLVCKEVREGEDGLPDAVGIMSEAMIPYKLGQPQNYDLKLFVLVSIYTEDEDETYAIALAVETPSEYEGEVGTVRLGNVAGHFLSTLAAPLSIEMNESGTYWVKVYYQQELLGEIPLKISFVQAVEPNGAVH